MFDMSWGEVMLIGGVALIVIGPKDLPKALRTVGQVTSKLKRMAGEFQTQFGEAMREAELDEVRREVEGINRSVTAAGTPFNPVNTIRNELRNAVDGAGAPKADPQALAAATAQLQAEIAGSGTPDPDAEARSEPARAGPHGPDAPTVPGQPLAGQTP